MVALLVVMVTMKMGMIVMVIMLISFSKCKNFVGSDLPFFMFSRNRMFLTGGPSTMLRGMKKQRRKPR